MNDFSDRQAVISDLPAFCPFYLPLYFHISIYLFQFVIAIFLKKSGSSCSNTTAHRPCVRPCSPTLRGTHFFNLHATWEPRRELSFVLGCLQSDARCCGLGIFVPV